MIKVVNKNITYSEMQLSPFSDDEIKGFIEENLHILNEDYLRQNTDNKFWLVNTNKVVC